MKEIGFWATLNVLKYHYLSHFLVKFIYIIDLCVCVCLRKQNPAPSINKKTQKSVFFWKLYTYEDVCEYCECVCVCVFKQEGELAKVQARVTGYYEWHGIRASLSELDLHSCQKS